MAKMLDYDQILTDISAYIPDGIVDFTKPLHVQVLKEALMEMGYPEEFIHEYSANLQQTAVKLQEKKPTPKKAAVHKPRPKTSTQGETGASAEARKKGLEHIAFKYYGKNGKVMFMSSDDKSKLLPLKPEEKAKIQKSLDKKTGKTPSKKPSGKVAQKPTPKKILVRKNPMATKDDYPDEKGTFTMKSEVSKGMFAEQYKIVGDNVEVRVLVDEGGNEIDVSSQEGRVVAIKRLDDRIKHFGRKIQFATELLTDKDKITKFSEKTGEQGINIFKWLGEVGELKTLQSFLETGATAYMLTDSMPKNDLVILTPTGDERGVQLGFVSVKTAEGGTNANKRGANCKADFKAYLHEADNKTVKIPVGDGETPVNASSYINATIDVKSFIYNIVSKMDGVCRDGALYLHPENFLPTAKEVVQRKGKTLKFEKDTDYLRNRKLDEKSVEQIFGSEKIKDMFRQLDGSESDPNEAAALHQHFKNDILNRIRQSNGNYTLGDLMTWENENIGNALQQTQAPIFPTADTAVAKFTQGRPDLEVGIVPADMIAKEVESQVGAARSVTDPAEQRKALVKATGLSQRVRKLGKKDECKGHYDGIDNLNPTVDVSDKDIPVGDYVKNYVNKS